ncbi:MAG: 3-hydroxyacyl-[acyl-carrier-protein] dehydratase, FabZ form, partial [uncultured Rubellimicrobium sp.]
GPVSGRSSARHRGRYPPDPAHPAASLPVPPRGPRPQHRRHAARAGDQERVHQRAAFPGPLPRRACDARRHHRRGHGPDGGRDDRRVHGLCGSQPGHLLHGHRRGEVPPQGRARRPASDGCGDPAGQARGQGLAVPRHRHGGWGACGRGRVHRHDGPEGRM